jgi:thiol-disulfide isomerase/thioredoxin
MRRADPRRYVYAVLVAILIVVAPGPAAAQECEDCDIIKRGLPDTAATVEDASPALPVVHVVLYWTEGCGYCHEIMEELLPALQQEHGAQLEVRLIEVVSLEDITAFFDVAETHGYARGKAAAPFLLVGDRALMGREQITGELPGLIDALLLAGGAGWPSMTPGATGETAAPARDVCGVNTPCADGPAVSQDGVDSSTTAATTPSWLAPAAALSLAVLGLAAAGFAYRHRRYHADRTL